MVHSRGRRRGTRYLFAKKFRKHGNPTVSTYLRDFKIGDYVDIKVNGTIHKGMPYKYYHGRTGKIWNISPRAVGVEVYRPVRGKLYLKRLYVRLEHVVPSKCCKKDAMVVDKKKEKKEKAKIISFDKKKNKIVDVQQKLFEYIV